MLRQQPPTASEAMLANANIKASWLHPSQHTARKDNLCGGMILVRGISTFAFLPSLGERLLYYQSTSKAGLRCVTHADFKNPDIGLVFENRKKLVPASILHRTGKPVIPQHPLDIEAFHSDCAVAVHHVGRDFEMWSRRVFATWA